MPRKKKTIKPKIDEVNISIRKDRQGYDAYQAELKFKGKLILY